jgi:hypothetical protein
MVGLSDLDAPIHWHGSSGLASLRQCRAGRDLAEPVAHGFHFAVVRNPGAIDSESDSLGSARQISSPHWVCAETGLGWVNYVLEAWIMSGSAAPLTAGILTRPSELFRRQISSISGTRKQAWNYATKLAPRRSWWESDYPHQHISKVVEVRRVGFGRSCGKEDERKKLLTISCAPVQTFLGGQQRRDGCQRQVYKCRRPRPGASRGLDPAIIAAKWGDRIPHLES